MKTADLFESAQLPVRAKAIRRGGAVWLRRNRRMVEAWASDIGLDITDAMSADCETVEVNGHRAWSGKPESGSVALLVPNSPWWTGPGRAELYRSHLEECGVNDCSIIPADGSLPGDLSRYKVVFNHALCASIAGLNSFAQQCPQAQIVHVNHSAVAYLEYKQGYLQKYIQAVRAAQQLPNVWCITQDENALHEATSCDRVRQVPMPLIAGNPRQQVSSGVPSVALAGRVCPVKNQLNAITAAKLAGVHLHVCVDLPDAMRDWIDLLNVPATYHGFMGHRKWLEFLDAVPDVVLQPSLAESFNNVAFEATSRGVPVIATHCVTSVDLEIVLRESNSPHSMAMLIREVLSDYAHRSRRAARIAQQVASERTEMYERFVAEVLNG